MTTIRLSPTLLVLISTLAPIHAQQQCKNAASMTCDADVLACCDANFRSQIQISDKCNGAPLYQDPSCYLTFIREKEWSNVDGVLQLCGAFNVFRDCLDPSTRSCTTYPWFLKNYYAPDVALTTQSTYHGLTFLCGAGLDAWVHNFQCMKDTLTQVLPKLISCWNEFLSNVAGDPDHTCDYLWKLTGCAQKLLMPCGEEAAWWGCEIVRTQTALHYHECTSFCTAQKKLN